MDTEEILRKLEQLREQCKLFLEHEYTQKGHENIAMLYGQLEPFIEKVLGVEQIEVELSHDHTVKCKNYIEAGFLTGRTIHDHVGYQHLLKVIARVKNNPEILTESNSKKEKNKNENTIKLFISHSSEDVLLAECLIELLRNALKLSSEDIRCTSVDGYRLPIGVDTDEQLKVEVLQCEVLIGLISPYSTDSMYVLFELGARWGASRPLFPLLALGVTSGFLKRPLSEINALRCDNSSQLHQLIRDLSKALKVSPDSPSAYQKYIDRILNIAPSSNTSIGKEKEMSAPNLSDLQHKIICQIAEIGGKEATIRKISIIFKIPEIEAEYNLDELVRIGLLKKITVLSTGDFYYKFTHEGRRYVLSQNEK